MKNTLLKTKKQKALHTTIFIAKIAIIVVGVSLVSFSFVQILAFCFLVGAIGEIVEFSYSNFAY